MSERQKVLKVWSRRNRVDYMTKEERSLLDARIAINKLGSHSLIREAVNLIREAQEKLADFVEIDQMKPLPPTHRMIHEDLYWWVE